MGSLQERIDKRDIGPSSNEVDEALRASEARYRRLFEAAKDGILIIDADTGRITDANPFLVNLLGYELKDFIGKALWDFGPFKDIQASESAFRDLMSNGYIRYEHLPLETQDGRRIEVEFVSNIYQVGQKRTIQCNIRDNSQRKQAEKDGLELEARLKQAQKMAAIATLAGGIAHQFNNALFVITASLELLEMKAPQNADSATYIETMKTSAFRMAQLTSQLLDYARGGSYQVKPVSLSDLVREKLPLLQRDLKSSIQVETHLQSDVWKIKADSTQMRAVLSALVTNSIEAMNGEGRIKIVCRNEVLSATETKSVPVLAPGRYVSMVIEDNGKGMDEETRKRAFEPFFTTKFVGRGLGLAAVYGIVKNHDGWIALESQLGRGTMVRIHFPVVLEAREEKTCESEAAKPARGSRLERPREAPAYAQSR
ncbi:MAG: PAS domain S-box protein [Desulfobacterales bacterium]|nr:PAS domain S-box protein [Desulfomonile tiedjei]MBI5896878.1 PAS domain S-box protein [Desulfobacterales bacterium]